METAKNSILAHRQERGW